MEAKYKDKKIEFKEETTVGQLLEKEIKESEHEVIAATFNNEYVNLNYKIKESGEIKLIDLSSKAGMRIYRNTLIYILGMAFEKLFPDRKMTVNYQLTNSMFCDIDNTEVTEEIVQKLNEEMKRIVKENLPIRQAIMTREEAKKLYDQTNTFKGRLQFDFEENKEIYMYYCEDYYNYCYGTIANRTGITKIFEVMKYSDGFLIRYPSSSAPEQMPKLIHTKKLAWALDEYDDIHKILNMNTVYKLNSAVENGEIKDVIMLDEALHEKKIANIADDIAKNRNIKMILIAGPSSSGKTTFAQRLGLQLRINRIKPVTISVDNYFVEREQTPRDENGEYNFECIEAIDLKLFNEHLTKLLNGEEIMVPTFNFKTGHKEYNGETMKIKDNEVLVIEGIHCLNDKLTASIPREQKYKVYISALTVLNIDYYNRISTTDTRLIRRMVRDYNFRGYSALHTLQTWNSVNKGEESNIFPFQEEADSMFNSSLIYEICVLKKYAMPLLKAIDNTHPEYSEAKSLYEFLKYFDDISDEFVPKNSLIREFIGGSIFEV